MKAGTIFWDVDTQFDFMSSEGKLYVPGAEAIIEIISDIRAYALDNGFSMLADIDWHSRDNPEISDHPDFQETFPPHCMAGEPGSMRIGYLGRVPLEYVDINQTDTQSLRKLVQKDPFHIVLRKRSLNVFDNPNTDTLVDIVAPQRAIVFGVALDCCVRYVCLGLAKRHGVAVWLLADAVKGLQTRPDEDIYDELRQAGVTITTFDEIRGQIRDWEIATQSGFKEPKSQAAGVHQVKR
jgi:nicotinamidase/pyrazinamidase